MEFKGGGNTSKILCLSWGKLDLDLSGPVDLCLHEQRRVAAWTYAAPFPEALRLIGQGEDRVKSQHVVGVRISWFYVCAPHHLFKTVKELRPSDCRLSLFHPVSSLIPHTLFIFFFFFIVQVVANIWCHIDTLRHLLSDPARLISFLPQLFFSPILFVLTSCARLFSPGSSLSHKSLSPNF